MFISITLLMAGLALVNPTVTGPIDWHDGAARAIYFMTNPFLAPNSVVAIPIGKDGSLSEPVYTLTGGNGGGYGKNVVTGLPGGPDAFGSQGSVQVAANVSDWTIL